MVLALAFAVLPATARAVDQPPKPPIVAGGEYLLQGSLSSYVRATPAADGSITIKVASANGPASFTVGKTLRFRITTATQIVSGAGGIGNGMPGRVRVTGPPKVVSLSALQALPAATVVTGP